MQSVLRGLNTDFTYVFNIMTPYENAKDLISIYQKLYNDFDLVKAKAVVEVKEIMENELLSNEELKYWKNVESEIYATPDPFIISEAKADQFNI